MATSEKDRFVSAKDMWAKGDRQKALKILGQLCNEGLNAEVRLESALFLLDHLKVGSDVEVLLEASASGIEAARSFGDSRSLAYIMGLRAKSLAFFNGMLVVNRKNLRLAPGWLGFSLEHDEAQYAIFTDQMHSNDEEADRLITRALRLCTETEDKSLCGHVLLSAGNIEFQRYMTLKVDRKPTRITVPWRMRKLLLRYGLDDWLLYNNADRRALLRHLEDCERKYCDAAEAFRLAGDELNAGYAFFNVANDLRSAFRLRRANRYLKQATSIAQQHGEQNLLQSIRVVEKSNRLRNRDVPNYAAGETRDQQ